MKGLVDPRAVRFVGGPGDGFLARLPPEQRVAYFETPSPNYTAWDARGEPVPWERGEVTRYHVRPAGPGVDELWIAVEASRHLAMASVFCILGGHQVPADRVVAAGTMGGAVCDICSWDLVTHRLERAG